MKSSMQKSISNLSVDLLSHALQIIQHEALPFYKRNIDQRDPPLSRGEYTPCAIGAVLLTCGLDYHLARLKYFRDIVPSKPPLPHTPYFNWEIHDYLTTKISRLLVDPTEKRLKDQLMELTVMRDSVAHPKLYVIGQLLKSDNSYTKPSAKLTDGAKHREKALERKLKLSERTKSLRLPLVATWISYVDIVICILVLNRFLNLLEEKYGNFYAMPGRYFPRNKPAGFFPGWKSKGRVMMPMEEWVQAFFDSLSPIDQHAVRKRLGCKPSIYILKCQSWESDPDFLSKAPPWPTVEKLQKMRKGIRPNIKPRNPPSAPTIL